MTNSAGKIPVVVLGASGMLGAMLVDVLSADPSLDVRATTRTEPMRARLAGIYSSVEWRLFDAESTAPAAAISSIIDGAHWVVNCIGVIKPYIHDDRTHEVERAIRVNALFPHALAHAAAAIGAHVLQIATDCVYSGTDGSYVESAPHDALDVYGKTKSLGEVPLSNVHLLRCSIIGPELHGMVSLLEWFVRQPRGATVKGFTNHRWNGVTTLHFARLCHGTIRRGSELPRLQHVIPTGTVSKADMLSCFASAYGRADVHITPTDAVPAIDRTLATEDAERNAQLWRAAGYAAAPSVPEMIKELSRGSYRFREGVA